MDFVREAAHRAILIDNAKVIMDGEPEEVCDRLVRMSHASYLEHDLKELAD
jgi:methyl coenzyme M reductase system subunit A2